MKSKKNPLSSLVNIFSNIKESVFPIRGLSISLSYSCVLIICVRKMEVLYLVFNLPMFNTKVHDG